LTFVVNPVTGEGLAAAGCAIVGAAFAARADCADNSNKMRTDAANAFTASSSGRRTMFEHDANRMDRIFPPPRIDYDREDCGISRQIYASERTIQPILSKKVQNSEKYFSTLKMKGFVTEETRHW